MAWTLDSSSITMDEVLVTTDGSTPWAGVDGLIVSSVGMTLALASWSAATDIAVTGYKLRLTTGGVPTIINVGNVTFHSLTGLTPATAYLLEIAAYDSAGDLSAYAPGTFTFATFSSITGVSRMTPQYVFGPGVGWITPLTDSTGTAIANPAPVLIAAMQDCNLDFSAEVKQLYGSKSYAVAIGRGKQKLGVKVKNGAVHGRLWNNMFFGQSLSAGIYSAFFDTTGTVLSATTVTPTVPGSGTYGYDLGVRDVNDLPLARVATGPAAGQYSMSAGVYTFSAADVSASLKVFISFNYTGTSTVAQKLVITNQPMGYAPTFQFDLTIPYQGNVFNATLFNCMSTKLGMATKLDDFAYPEFDFDAFAPGSATIGELSWSQ